MVPPTIQVMGTGMGTRTSGTYLTTRPFFLHTHDTHPRPHPNKVHATECVQVLTADAFRLDQTLF